MAYREFHDHYCGSKAILPATMLVDWKAEPRVMEYLQGKMTFNWTYLKKYLLSSISLLHTVLFCQPIKKCYSTLCAAIEAEPFKIIESLNVGRKSLSSALSCVNIDLALKKSIFLKMNQENRKQINWKFWKLDNF